MSKLFEIRDWERLASQARFRPESMAALCPVSLRQLERFFSKKFQKTPQQWARQLRGRLALELISQGWSSKAVAGQLHFWDESHFCNEFKRVHGAPPQAFAPSYHGRSLDNMSGPQARFSQTLSI